jgi:replication factor C subunit 3/5
MSADTITEDAVYQCTGNPLPKDIEQVAHWLLNEKFTDAFESECRSCPKCFQSMCGDHG